MPVIHRKLPILSKQDIKRFWSKVDKTPGQGPKGDCWEWIAVARSIGGYGLFNTKKGAGKARVQWYAPRLSYFIATGIDPGPLQIRHIACHNRLCVNPTHLTTGTGKDNAADALRDGTIQRGDNHYSRRRPELVGRGGKHWARQRPESVHRGPDGRYVKDHPGESGGVPIEAQIPS